MIQHKGIVKEVKDDIVQVVLSDEVICSSCSAKGACGLSEDKTKVLNISNRHQKFLPGEKVFVLFNESLGPQAVALGYVYPFFCLILTLGSASIFTKNELIIGLIALGILIPYYGVLFFF